MSPPSSLHGSAPELTGPWMRRWLDSSDFSSPSLEALEGSCRSHFPRRLFQPSSAVAGSSAAPSAGQGLSAAGVACACANDSERSLAERAGNCSSAPSFAQHGYDR